VAYHFFSKVKFKPSQYIFRKLSLLSFDTKIMLLNVHLLWSKCAKSCLLVFTVQSESLKFDNSVRYLMGAGL
jgi:hypothetical protein